VFAISRAGFQQLRKTGTAYRAVFAGWDDVAGVISTASSCQALVRCGFGWKAKLLTLAQLFFSHHHQICGLLLHSLCTMNRR